MVSVPSANRSDSGPGSPNLQEDLAEEASHTPNANPAFKRPVAPRLSPDHMWGIREDWGSKVKDWGKGAKIHKRHKEETSPGTTSSER
jgi:protein AFG1